MNVKLGLATKEMIIKTVSNQNTGKSLAIHQIVVCRAVAFGDEESEETEGTKTFYWELL
jgi:hypothetical protein